MTESDQVWVIDDDRSIRWVLEKALAKAGMRTTAFSNANGVMEALEREQPERKARKHEPHAARDVLQLVGKQGDHEDRENRQRTGRQPRGGCGEHRGHGRGPRRY